jgi:hypothetical protein
MPIDAHKYGLVSSRNWPTLNASPEPAHTKYKSSQQLLVPPLRKMGDEFAPVKRR